MSLQRTLVTHLGAALLGAVACAPAAPDPPISTATGGLPGSGGQGGNTSSATGGAATGTGGSGGDTMPSNTGGVMTSGGTSTGGLSSTGGTVTSGGTQTNTGGILAGGTPGTGGATGGAGGATGGTGNASGGSAGFPSGSGGKGGTASGGAPGGGSTGAGCPAGTFLCEGFESYTEGMSPAGTWARDVRGGGQINVESSRPFAGTKALHVTGMMNADRANIRTPLAIAANTVFVRFMMYTAGYPSSSGVHTRLMRLGTNAGAPTGNPESCYSFASYNGTAIEKVNSIYLRNTQTHLNDAAVKNRWVCWEFEIDKTGGVGKVAPHIWLDGRELALAAAGSASHGMTSPSWDPIPIETFIMGLDGFQADSVRADFWIDDLVIHSQRIGCPAAP